MFYPVCVGSCLVVFYIGYLESDRPPGGKGGGDVFSALMESQRPLTRAGAPVFPCAPFPESCVARGRDLISPQRTVSSFFFLFFLPSFFFLLPPAGQAIEAFAPRKKTLKDGGFWGGGRAGGSILHSGWGLRNSWYEGGTHFPTPFFFARPTHRTISRQISETFPPPNLHKTIVHPPLHPPSGNGGFSLPLSILVPSFFSPHERTDFLIIFPP